MADGGTGQHEFVILVSPEGQRFVIPYSAALGSDFIKSNLTSDFEEASTGIITLPDIRAEVLEKVCEYLMYKERYANAREDPPDFADRVRPEIALEL